MSLYSYTFNSYDFVPGELVTISLTKEPYAGVVVSFGGDVSILDETAPTGEGVQFEYTVLSIPDGFDVEALNDTAFTNLLGTIMLGWIEKNFEDNGSTFGGVVNIHAPVPETEDKYLEPKTIEFDADSGATTINYT